MENQEFKEKSFAEFMAENPIEREWLQPGQKVEATIVKITPEWIFIDLGSKSEGYLDSKEFLDESGKFAISEGDKIKAYFLSSRNNEKLFTTLIGRGDAAKTYLEDACRNGIPIEGRIAKETKGGYEVIIAGDVRAFCPFSQLGLPRNEDVSEYFGKNLAFKIMEFGENGRNVVLSRREILEEEKAKRKKDLKETLKEGMLVQGKVISLHKFGAFVDIGGIHGLLPLSELGWDRSEDIKDIISIGDELSLSIIKLDWDSDKITLSRKATLPDPRANIERDFPKGSLFKGRVSSLTNFGAFISLDNGVEGLIHISKLGKGKRIKHAGEVLAKGQVVEVIIEDLNSEKKRISLSLAGADVAEQEESTDDYRRYMGASPLSFGSLGDALRRNNNHKVA